MRNALHLPSGSEQEAVREGVCPGAVHFSIGRSVVEGDVKKSDVLGFGEVERNAGAAF